MILMTVLSKTLSNVGQAVTGTTPPHIKALRLQKCYVCKTAVNTPNVGLTCGPYLQPVIGVNCGCVIEDAIAVAGKQCPQKKWLAV